MAAITVVKKTSTLGEIAVAIKEQILAKATASMETGRLLAEAKSEFEKMGEFYSWTSKTCGVGKSQACDLIKIYEGFKAERNKKVLALASRVKLAILRSDGMLTDVKAALKKGEVIDTQWVKAWKLSKSPEASNDSAQAKAKEMTAERKELVTQTADYIAQLMTEGQTPEALQAAIETTLADLLAKA